MAPVGWPPVLAVGHQGFQVALQCFEIEFLEFFGVVEIVAQRIGLAVVLMEDVQIQCVGPPGHIVVAGRGVTTMHDRAGACWLSLIVVTHKYLLD